MSKPAPISVIMRGLDGKSFSNKFIVALCFGAFFGYALLVSLQGVIGPDVAVIVGVSAAASIAVSWILAREADPDHSITANLAAIATAIIFYFTLPDGRVMLLEPLVVALCVRMIARTTGPKFTAADLSVIWFLLLVSAFMTGTWALVLMVGIAYVIDWLFPEGNNTAAVFVVGTALLTTWILGWMGVGHWVVTSNVWLWLAVTIIILAYIFTILIGKEKVNSKADLTGKKLNWHRVLEARIWLVWTALVLSLNANLGGAGGMWLIWLVVIAVIFRKTFKYFLPCD